MGGNTMSISVARVASPDRHGGGQPDLAGTVRSTRLSSARTPSARAWRERSSAYRAVRRSVLVVAFLYAIVIGLDLATLWETGGLTPFALAWPKLVYRAAATAYVA